MLLWIDFMHYLLHLYLFFLLPALILLRVMVLAFGSGLLVLGHLIYFEWRYNILIMGEGSTVLAEGLGELLVLFELVGIDGWLGTLEGGYEIFLGNHADV